MLRAVNVSEHISEQEAWQRVMDHAGTVDTVPPQLDWFRAAHDCVSRLGRERFAQLLTAWLAAIARPGAVALTRAESRHLIGLLYCGVLVHDEAVERALLNLVEIRWEPRDARLLVQSAVAWAVSQLSPETTWTPLAELRHQLAMRQPDDPAAILKNEQAMDAPPASSYLQ